MELLPVLEGKCPHCKKGSIFKYPLKNLYHYSVMNSSCDHCHVTFQPEPGFYFGALYISYAFNVAFFISISILLSITIRPQVWVYVFAIIFCSVIFIPISFRYSRILFLYWFGGLKSK